MKLSVAVPSHLPKLRLTLPGLLLVAFVFLLIPASSRAQVQLVPVITTVAGDGTGGYSGDSGPATSAELFNPNAVAVDAAGNLYIAEYSNNRIRKVSPSGIITTVVGNGTQGYSGDNGPATSAELYHPFGVALDASGNLYIADWGNDRVRQVSPSGIITTVAGNGTAGYSGDNGPATSAELNYPTAVVVDASGNLYIADVYNSLIRQVSPSGIITTVAGNGTAGYSGDNGPATSAALDYPLGVALDASGNLYIADASNNRIRMVSPSGIITTVAGNGTAGYSGDNGPATSAELNYPNAVTLDASGNIYITDNNRIRKVDPSGNITTVAGNGTGGYSGDNGPATSAELSGAYGVALDAGGNLYIADEYTNRIRKVSEVSPGLNETITAFPTTAVGASAAVQNVLIETTATETIVSISVPVSQGGFQEFSVGAITGCTIGASNASGTTCTIPITFTPAYPGLRQLPLQVVTSAGNVSFGLQGTGTGPQVALTPGLITTVAGNGVHGFYSGDNGPATSAELGNPWGMALDASGNLYIADYFNDRVRKVSPSGIITTVAGNGTEGYSGDNGPATSAALEAPYGVALDASGNLYIADEVNNRIRMVSPSGIITTVAGNGTEGYSGDNGLAISAELYGPVGVALDASGNLYIADSYNNRIRKVSPSGIITTVAGNGGSSYSGGSYPGGDNGPATSAEVTEPLGVALDASGNLYIADFNNNRIRMVNPSGIITTVAGNGTQGFSGDNGPATSAELANPWDVALDASGNLYIADYGNIRIRKVSPSGIITTVAGNGTEGFSGDNGPATSAEMVWPTGVALDASGNLYIADTGNQRIRKVNVGITTALNFANTVVGSQSTDSPQSFELGNIGNTALTLSIPSTGNNPSIAPGFSYDASSTCPQLSPGSSASILASGTSCTFAVDFIPLETGLDNGNLVLSDNSLNNTGSTQTVSLNGIGAGPPVDATLTVVNISPGSLMAGQAATLTAMVTDTINSGSMPTGTVTFTDALNGGTPVALNGGNPVALISGVATLPGVMLSQGSHLISATYGGVTGMFLASSSTGLSQVVTAAGPLVSPVISPAGGSYSSAQTVTLTDAISGAAFYYTTDGSIPNTNSTLYTGPIIVSSSETISAIATASGYTPSPTATAAYLISPLAVGGTLQWSWMGGANTAGTFGQPGLSGQAGVYGTLGMPAAGNVPGGRVSPTTWTDSQGNLWLFGGEGYDAVGTSGLLNDLWKFNPSTNLWVWMGGSSTLGSNGGQAGVYGTLGTPAAGNIPGSRYSASVWTDGSGNIWLFGGGGYDANGTNGYLNDLWEFNPSANVWTWVGGNSTLNSTGGEVGVYGTLGVPAIGNIPGGRSSTSTWTDSSGNFWLLGGQGPDADGNFINFGDLWEFNNSTSQWAWMGGGATLSCTTNGCSSPTIYGTLGTPAAGNFPGKRASSSSWTDLSGNFWLFGGYGVDANGNGGPLNDLWEFNPSTNQWTWMSGSSTMTCAQFYGCGQPGVYGTLGTPASGNTPGARNNASAWTDSSGNLWLFGGSGDDAIANVSNLNDLWEFNPSTNQWAWMGGSSLVGANNCFSIYGGTMCGQAGVYGTLGTPSGGNIPGGRSSASGGATGASWIDNNGNLWLFGGWAFDTNGSSGYLNDLWEYQPPAASLPAAATPTFSVATGTYNAPQTVTVSDTTNGATIYYTTNGTTPNRASSVFSNAITISATETLKAIAVGTNYKQSAVATAEYTINLPVTPSITWTTPGAISYGTPLSAAQLDASSTVAGTFAYSPASGTVLAAGTQTLMVTFTPTDTADFTIATATVQLLVDKAIPVITWANPTAIPYGTALSATQLNATASVGGTFFYSPAAGAILSVGTQTLSVTFTPIDSNDYTMSTATTMLVVSTASFTINSTVTGLSLTSGGSGVNTIPAGSEVTLTASVTSNGNPVTSGQVIFCNAAAAHCTDINLLGAAQLTPTGTATLSFYPRLGSHSYSAQYVGVPSGSTPYGLSTSASASLTVTGLAPTTTTITASGTPGDLTLTATVVGYQLTTSPTGTVSFLDTTNSNAVLGTTPLGAGTPGLNFSNVANPATGQTPVYLAVGDFNGDGKQDMAVIDSGNNTVTILLGNGDGTFVATANSPATGNYPWAIAAGDFNSDGKLDLAVTNRVDSTVTILLGNGDGTFTATSNSPETGSQPISIVVGDLNGDGKPDLAVTNFGSDNVAILLGNGDGTFTATANSPETGSQPISIVVGDLNGDGKPDLAISNAVSNTITVLLGNGDGTFTPSAASPTTDLIPESIVTGDFNGDGRLDLAVANHGSNTVTIMLGNGDGTFKTEPSTPVASTYPISMVIGDFNGDGKPDLAVASSGNDTVTILLGNGDGTFTTMPSNLATGRAPSYVVVGDFNGDGIPDIATANNDANTVTVLDGSLTETATATVSGISVSGPGSHALDASYSGDNIFAASVSQAITVNQQQTINFAPLTSPATYGVGPIALSATGGGSGNPVLFSVISGPGTVIGDTLTIIGAGTVVVAANQAGNSNYLAAMQVTQSITVNKAAQTISFTPPASPISYQTAPVTLSATTSSGLPVVFSVLSGPATISGNTLTITGVGTVRIAANQLGNANFLPAAQVTNSIKVNNAAQTISFTPLPTPVTYGIAPMALSATASSGLPVVFSVVSGPGTVSGSTLTITAAGTVKVAANQAGNTDYLAAPQVTQTIAVSKATPVITWPTPALITYGTALSATQLDASSNIGGTFAYTPAAGKVLASGSQTLSVTFTPTNTTDYAKVAATVQLTVNQATPVITWNAPAAITYGKAISGTQLNAKASVGGTFVYTPPAGTLLNAGTQTLSLTFTPTNSTDYTTATASVQLTVNQGTQSINFTQPTSPVSHTGPPVTLNATASSGLSVSFSVLSGPGTVSGNTLTVTGVGTIVVAANQGGNANYLAASQVTRSIVAQ